MEPIEGGWIIVDSPGFDAQEYQDQMSSITSVSSHLDVVVAATFTAEPLALPLEAWWRWLGVPAKLRFAPYNQLFQQLLDPHGLLASNLTGTNVLLVRLDDWFQAGRPAEAENRAEDFYNATQKYSERAGGAIFVCFCPGSSNAESDRRTALEEVEANLVARLDELPNVFAIPSTVAGQLYPVREIEDNLAKRAGQIPYSQPYFTSVATLLARRIHTLQRRAQK